jgi:hypothetical protein
MMHPFDSLEGIKALKHGQYVHWQDRNWIVNIDENMDITAPRLWFTENFPGYRAMEKEYSPVYNSNRPPWWMYEDVYVHIRKPNKAGIWTAETFWHALQTGQYIIE